MTGFLASHFAALKSNLHATLRVLFLKHLATSILGVSLLWSGPAYLLSYIFSTLSSYALCCCQTKLHALPLRCLSLSSTIHLSLFCWLLLFLLNILASWHLSNSPVLDAPLLCFHITLDYSFLFYISFYWNVGFPRVGISNG